MRFTIHLYTGNANLNANMRVYKCWVESLKLYNSYFAAPPQMVSGAGQRRQAQARLGKVEEGREDCLMHGAS